MQTTQSRSPLEKMRLGNETRRKAKTSGSQALEKWWARPLISSEAYRKVVRLQDPLARRDALNRFLRTPKITYEGILMDAYQQQQMQSQYEAQKRAAAEAEAMERAKRMYAEQQQRQFARLDNQGNQPRRF